MTNNKKIKKRTYKVLLILSALLLVALSIWLISSKKQLGKYQTEQLVPISQYNELNEQYQILIQLSEIDEDFIFSNNIKKAISEYESLITNDKNFKNTIEERIKFLQKVLESQSGDDTSFLKDEIAAYKEKIDSLEVKNDSVQGILQSKITMLTHVNDSLNSIAAEKGKLQQRAEVVKVITFKNESGNLIHYVGETKNEMANGNGVGIWDNGSIYRGEWRNNLRNGEGDFTWKDGAKFEGDFVMGIRSGKGTFYYKTGEKYVGDFKDGLRHGKGILYDRDNNTSFNGEWKNDKPIQ
ncbi:MORN repeat-containing protein [Paucihalobacter sp.]|uniref:MORN repeat-containing protein n=1 Tax=Paucihalobacter sp. TaxID=2850405 RepID=UPI002FE3376B